MKLLLLFLSFSLVTGCSFKKDGGDKKSQNDSSHTREVVEKTITSVFDKLAYAIETNDSILFDNTLKIAKKSDLNQLSPYGRSLLEISLQKNALEFFRKLINAGASPFRPTQSSPEGLRTTYLTDVEAKKALTSAVHGGLAEATRMCLLNDLRSTIEYLKENFISPSYRVCGSLNLFQYYLNKIVSGLELGNDLKIELIKGYVNFSRQDREENISAILSVALETRDGGIIALVANECLRIERMCTSVPFDGSIFINSKIEDVLGIYRVFRTAIFNEAIFVYEARFRAPPLPNGHFEEPKHLDIVTYVKNLVRDRVEKLDDYTKERLAQQLHELELD